jgi:glutaredoxin
MKALLPQQCPLVFLYFSWALYIAGLIYFPWRGDYALAAVWLVVLPLAWWGYVQLFPRVAPLLGYGSVADEAPEAIEAGGGRVVIYSSVGCPFCPIVEKRLNALQEQMGFELQRIDVTLRPDLLRDKGIRGVPVVEVGKRRLVGHATKGRRSWH